MATKTLKSIKGRRMRLTRLDECCEPVIGACSSLVTDGFITVTWNPEIESGEEFTQKNAWGDFCINEQDDDRIKWMNVNISMCEVDPDALDIIGAGSPITDGTDTIGTSFGPNAPTGRFALEVWTKASGAGACGGGTTEWGYWVAPCIGNGRIDGDMTIENAALTLGMVGRAKEATDAWGVNPYGDNPLIAAAGFPVGDFLAVVRTTVQPPDVTAGCVALT